eukprot:g45559.t1
MAEGKGADDRLKAAVKQLGTPHRHMLESLLAQTTSQDRHQSKIWAQFLDHLLDALQEVSSAVAELPEARVYEATRVPALEKSVSQFQVESAQFLRALYCTLDLCQQQLGIAAPTLKAKPSKRSKIKGRRKISVTSGGTAQTGVAIQTDARCALAAALADKERIARCLYSCGLFGCQAPNCFCIWITEEAFGLSQSVITKLDQLLAQPPFSSSPPVSHESQKEGSPALARLLSQLGLSLLPRLRSAMRMGATGNAWKQAGQGARHVVWWLMDGVDPATPWLETHLADLLPLVLPLCADSDSHNKVLGISALNKLLRKAPAAELSVFAPMLLRPLQDSLSFREKQVLEQVLPCLILAVSVLYGPAPCVPGLESETQELPLGVELSLVTKGGAEGISNASAAVRRAGKAGRYRWSRQFPADITRAQSSDDSVPDGEYTKMEAARREAGREAVFAVLIEELDYQALSAGSSTSLPALRVLCHNLPALCRVMGLQASQFFRSLFPSMLTLLQLADTEAVESVLQAWVVVLLHCWPRLAVHVGTLFQGLLQVQVYWLGLDWAPDQRQSLEAYLLTLLQILAMASEFAGWPNFNELVLQVLQQKELELLHPILSKLSTEGKTNRTDKRSLLDKK